MAFYATEKVMDKPNAGSKPVSSASSSSAIRAGAEQTPATAKMQRTPDVDAKSDEAAEFLLHAEPVQKSVRPEPDLLPAAAREKEADPESSDVQAETKVQPPPEAETKESGRPSSAAAAAAKDAPEPKTVMLGDFRLVKKLGAGSIGAVYKAHQISLDRDVAIKVLSKPLRAKREVVKRFYREARVLIKLDHPHLLRCHEVGEEQGFPYLAMDYAEGGNVETWLKKLGQFPPGDALRIGLDCASALQHVHELNLVHGNIKPENALLTKIGVVKLADLGLARVKDEELAPARTDPALYLAPEQIRDVKQINRRSDIYALGCMIYALLTGHPPFQAATRDEMIDAKEKGTFEPARRSISELPERLDLILDRMLAKEPDRRYQTCAELILDLEKLGLAHKKLSFLQLEGPSQLAAPAPPPPKKLPLHRPAAEAKEEGEPDVWYASFRLPDGKKVTKKLTTNQVMDLINSASFHPETQLSKTLHGTYRGLAMYPPFEEALRSQLTGDKAEARADKVRSLYDQIKKEKKSSRPEDRLEALFVRLRDMKLIILLGILVLLGLVLFFGLR
jgi:serine/threonine-protein kinase